LQSTRDIDLSMTKIDGPARLEPPRSIVAADALTKQDVLQGPAGPPAQDRLLDS
jgi:hypothetical protein